jgi:hypothetical protein
MRHRANRLVRATWGLIYSTNHIKGRGTRWSLINKRFNNSGPARFERIQILTIMNYRANECRAKLALAMPSAADSA